MLDAVLPLPLVSLLPPRGAARSPLELLPALRVRPCDCSLDRRGASNVDHVEGVGAVPIELDPPDPLEELVDPPLEPELDEDPPPSPPRGADDPELPLSPPRGTAVPVVFPFDVRSWAATVNPLTAKAIARVLMNLFLMTPPAYVADGSLTENQATALPVETTWLWPVLSILRFLDPSQCPLPSAGRPLERQAGSSSPRRGPDRSDLIDSDF